MGHCFAARAGRTDVPRIVDWYMAGKINNDDRSPCLPFEHNEGLTLMRRGESIRTVVDTTEVDPLHRPVVSSTSSGT